MSQKATTPETDVTETVETSENEKTVQAYLTKMKNSKRIRAAAIVTVLVGVTVLAAKKLNDPTTVEIEEETLQA